MNKHFFLILSSCLFLIVFSSHVFAQTNTVVPIDSEASSSIEVVNDSEVKQSIKQRIQEAVKKSHNEVTTTPTAFVGEIESITDQSITLTINSFSELLSITPETSIIDEDDEALTITDLEIGTGVIAISLDTSSGLAIANHIISLKELPQKSEKITALAQIVAVDEKTDELEVLIKPSMETITLSLAKNSQLGAFLLGEEFAIEDLVPGDEVVVIYNPDDNDYIVDVLEVIATAPITTQSATSSAKPEDS